MKDLDFKLRQRFERKEYEGDRYGETRLEKMLVKKCLKEKKQSCKRSNSNGNS